MDVSGIVAEAEAEAGRSAAARTSKLNPDAPEWRPGNFADNEDLRCLYVTFSNGHPLNENQLIRFFTMKYGPCVERVWVHRMRPRDKPWPPPLFGKVIFRSSCMPEIVLSGEDKVCFWIDGRPLWCKRFDSGRINTTPRPAPNQTDDGASTSYGHSHGGGGDGEDDSGYGCPGMGSGGGEAASAADE